MPFSHNYGGLLRPKTRVVALADFWRCTALVVLNSPDRSLSNEQVHGLASACGFVVAADGGANWLRGTNVRPNVLVGDLDSVEHETRSFYEKSSVLCQSDPDESRNDFQKALTCLPDAFQRAVVIGGDGGRFDHLLANIHAMYADAMHHQHRDVVLLSSKSMAFVLRPGGHTIHIDECVEGPSCGMFPMGGPCNVRTRNLQWDVNSEGWNGRPLEFGSFISSSNRILGNSVLIWTDAFLLWTHEVRWPSPGG